MRGPSVSNSIPSPVGGWNARDSLGAMPATDAVKLENWYPNTTDLQLRLGHTQYATGLDGQCETLISFSGGAAVKLFGITDTGKIYDVSAGGAVGAPMAPTDSVPLGNGRCQYVNMSTAAGNFIRMVNGEDKSLTYSSVDGLWHEESEGAPYEITGSLATPLDTSTCIDVELFKFRMWFVQENTLTAWYLPTAAVGGAATPFYLQGIFTEGGNIVAMATWTVDAGYGVDDLLVFVSSRGQVVVYKGTDPASAATWALVGIWRVGAPVGRRCLVKWAGDLLIICQDGLYPLSGALQSSRVQPRVALTQKIQYAMSTAVSLYGANFGWQTFSYPKDNMLILNVPVAEGTRQQQYVMNTITKSWCKFTGWNANCWELFNDDPYFGGDGFVGKAWDTLSDAGVNIQSDCQQAFNYFRAPGKLKRWTMIRPVFLSNGLPTIYAAVNIDFSDAIPATPLSYTPTSVAAWDVDVWDVGAWGGDLTPLYQWQSVTGVGYCAALRLQSASQGIQVRWISTDYVWETGAIL
jgi:hypothetical protein